MKDFILKHKILIAAIGVVVVVGGIIGFNAWSNRKVDMAANAVLKFSGYNQNGTAELTEASGKKIMGEMIDRVGQKEKLSDSAIAYLKNNLTGETQTSIEDSGLSLEEQQKLNQLSDELEHNIKTGISPDDGLKNGQKVTFSVQVADSDLPIKTSSKTFTVSGLKKAKAVTATDLAKQLKHKFVGVNGKGDLFIKSTEYSDRTFTVANNGKLKNGDKVTITLSKSLVNHLGEDKTFTGSRSFTWTVSGLTEPKQVKNYSDVLRYMDELEKKDYPSDSFATHDAKELGTYIFSYDALGGSGLSEGLVSDDNSSSKVTVADDFDNVPEGFTIVKLYKMTETIGAGNPSSTSYVLDGYANLAVVDGQFNIENLDANNEDVGYQFDENTSLTTIQGKMDKFGLKLQ